MPIGSTCVFGGYVTTFLISTGLLSLLGIFEFLYRGKRNTTIQKQGSYFRMDTDSQLVFRTAVTKFVLDKAKYFAVM